MTFVVLYGPPAAGKLTVAQELAKLTGFRVFHNHFSVDLAEAVFTRSGPSFSRTVQAVNRVVFQEAARANVDLIFTFVYAYSQDDAEMQQMLNIFEERGAHILLVQLTCSQEMLRARLSEPSRQAYGKIKDVETLDTLLETYDLLTPYPARPSLQLDTTDSSPQKTAAVIAAQLPKGS